MPTMISEKTRRILIADGGTAIHENVRKILGTDAPAAKSALDKVVLFGDSEDIPTG